MSASKVIIITGPTSSGKTSLALNLCKQLDGVIVSADSRQIYKEFDIGTGKIPVGVETSYSLQKATDTWLIDGVTIWGYDLVSATQEFSAFDYKNFAVSTVNILRKKHPFVFVVGGTGFYLDVLTNRISLARVSPNPALRQELSELTTAELVARLGHLSSTSLEKIDKNNPARLIRAIELNHPTVASKPVELSHTYALDEVEFVWLGLTSSRDYLYTRADSWVQSVIEHGLIEEVQYLLSLGYRDTRPMQGIVYKTVVAHLNNEISYAAMVSKIQFELHAYIRRQQTWLKRNKNIKWLESSDVNLSKKALDLVL